jgi:hypothetical protein
VTVTVVDTTGTENTWARSTREDCQSILFLDLVSRSAVPPDRDSLSFNIEKDILCPAYLSPSTSITGPMDNKEADVQCGAVHAELRKASLVYGTHLPNETAVGTFWGSSNVAAEK